MPEHTEELILYNMTCQREKWKTYSVDETQMYAHSVAAGEDELIYVGIETESKYYCF